VKGGIILLRENEIGGTHINYYIHCKRQLWYYINNVDM